MKDYKTILTNQILNKIGREIIIRAKKNIPFDKGILAAMTNYEIIGNNLVISSNTPYADCMEYGCPPRLLNNREKDDLMDWARRKGFNKSASKNIVKKIEREGIKVGSVENPLVSPNGRTRPYLRPAIYSVINDINSIVGGD